jgi:hypothetical protein
MFDIISCVVFVIISFKLKNSFFRCPNAEKSNPASITFSAQQSGSAVVQGQFTVTVGAGTTSQLIKTGTLNGLQISGNTPLNSFVSVSHSSKRGNISNAFL